MPTKRHPRTACPELRIYRGHRTLSQAQLAQALGVTQAYISQLERGARPISKKLAAKLAALPTLEHLPATVFPEDLEHLDQAGRDLAADLGALGYPGFAAANSEKPKNPAAVIISILKQRQVAPAIMAAIPWVLLHFPTINTGWLVDQARLNNLQNRLGFLTALAHEIAAGRLDESPRIDLEAMRAQLDESRLAREDTLARVLTPADRQFFQEHRSETARHWNLLTGLTIAQLPYR